MASGNGKTDDATLEVLKDIRSGVTELREEMRSGFEQLSDRLDNVIQGVVGERFRDHEDRIRRLEKLVTK